MDNLRLKIARHETGHAVMALICRLGIEKVSLKEMESPNGAGKYLGFMNLDPSEKQKKLTVDLADRKIMISLGGYASEILFFGSANIASDDLIKAIEYTEAMLQVEEVRNKVASFPPPKPSVLDNIENPMIRTFIDYKMQKAIEFLAPLKLVIHSISEELIKKEELTGAEVAALFDSLTAPN